MKSRSKLLEITGIILLFVWGCSGSNDSDISRESILAGSNGKYWSDVRLYSDTSVGIGYRIFLKNDKTSTIQYNRALWSGNWELLNHDQQLHFFQFVNQQKESRSIYEIIELNSEEMQLRPIDSMMIENYIAEK